MPKLNCPADIAYPTDLSLLTPVLVSLSLNAKGNPLYTKMKVVPDVKGQTIEAFVKQAVADDTVLVSDGAEAYQQLGGAYKAVSMRFDPLQNPDHLQWLHKLISNAKVFVAGTYHGLEGSICNDT